MRFQRSISIAQALFLLMILMISINRGKGFNDNLSAVLPLITVHFLLISFLFLGHLYVLIPHFLDKRQTGLYLFALLFLLIGIMLFGQVFDWWWLGTEELHWFQLVGARQVLFTHIFVILAGYPFRLLRLRQQQERLKQQMEAYQYEAELRFLQAQVNPHFLLNVLNNAYSLAEMEMPEAGPTIQKLERMMQYMLMDCQEKLVPLQLELQYLEDFLELQQLRKDGLLNIEFEQMGKLDTLLIQPLLLIPFFENVFKHGNLENLQEGYLQASMELIGDKLQFKIENSLGERPKAHQDGGIGLENIRQRLALIYPDRHQLMIQREAKRFSVKMELILNSTNFQELAKANNI